MLTYKKEYLRKSNKNYWEKYAVGIKLLLFWSCDPMFGSFFFKKFLRKLMEKGKLKKVENILYSCLIYLKTRKVYFAFFFMKILFEVMPPFSVKKYKYGGRVERVPYYTNNFQKIKLSLGFLKKGILSWKKKKLLDNVEISRIKQLKNELTRKKQPKALSKSWKGFKLRERRYVQFICYKHCIWFELYSLFCNKVGFTYLHINNYIDGGSNKKYIVHF